MAIRTSDGRRCTPGCLRGGSEPSGLPACDARPQLDAANFRHGYAASSGKRDTDGRRRRATDGTSLAGQHR